MLEKILGIVSDATPGVQDLVGASDGRNRIVAGMLHRHNCRTHRGRDLGLKSFVTRALISRRSRSRGVRCVRCCNLKNGLMKQKTQQTQGIRVVVPRNRWTSLPSIDVASGSGVSILTAAFGDAGKKVSEFTPRTGCAASCSTNGCFVPDADLC